MTRVRNLMSRRQALGSLVLTTTGLTLTACGGTQLQQGVDSVTQEPANSPPDFSALFAQYTPADEPNGELSQVSWPQWLLELDPEVKRLYEFQITHGDLMRWMPCFCGCGKSSGHRSNRDCYVQAVNANGSVVFDDMAPT